MKKKGREGEKERKRGRRERRKGKRRAERANKKKTVWILRYWKGGKRRKKRRKESDIIMFAAQLMLILLEMHASCSSRSPDFCRTVTDVYSVTKECRASHFVSSPVSPLQHLHY